MEGSQQVSLPVFRIVPRRKPKNRSHPRISRLSTAPSAPPRSCRLHHHLSFPELPKLSVTRSNLLRRLLVTCLFLESQMASMILMVLCRTGIRMENLILRESLMITKEFWLRKLLVRSNWSANRERKRQGELRRAR